jgi:hypothetical protein
MYIERSLPSRRPQLLKSVDMSLEDARRVLVELEAFEATCTSFRMLVRVVAGIGLVRGGGDGVGIIFILILHSRTKCFSCTCLMHVYSFLYVSYAFAACPTT